MANSAGILRFGILPPGAALGQLAHTTLLLESLQRGDRDAAARLMEVVYQELRGLAGSYLKREEAGHTLQPTALVHEAFVKLIDRTSPAYNGRAHFFAVAAKAMRQILVDHARASNADKRGGGGSGLRSPRGSPPPRRATR